MKHAFKVGDIVICTEEQDDNEEIINSKGIVIYNENTGYSTVEFFNNIGGHCGNGEGHGKDEYCWIIPNKKLILYRNNKYEIEE
jgi:hypothetical protein